MSNPLDRPRAAVVRGLNALRRRWRWFDHLARAGGRYQSLFGDRVAAGLTYYSFLSFFPLVAVAFSVVGYLIAVDPDIRSQVNSALMDNFPGLIGGHNGINVQSVADAKTLSGVLGLLGLVYTGLGWLSAVRSGLRVMWGMGPSTRNLALRKLDDLGLLLVIGFALLVSLTIAGFGSAYTVQLLRLLGLSHSFTGNLVTKVVAALAGFLVDLPLFTLVFTGLSGWRPRRRVLRGVLFASLGFEVLKLVGSVLLARTTSKPVYATFAVIVGLLVWMYLANRVLLFAAAWTVTGPGDDGPTEPVHRPWRRAAAQSARVRPRAAPSLAGVTEPSETEVLLRYLAKNRDAVVGACDGLSDEEQRRPGVPSGTNLLGIIHHLAGIEAHWFRRVFAGEDLVPDDSLVTPDTMSRADVVAAYRVACAQSDAIVRGCPDLTTLAAIANPGEPEPVSLRRITVHMIEETARHAGQADILRELIDGATEL